MKLNGLCLVKRVSKTGVPNYPLILEIIMIISGSATRDINTPSNFRKFIAYALLSLIGQLSRLSFAGLSKPRPAESTPPISQSPARSTSSMIVPLISFLLISAAAGQVLSPSCYDSCVLASCTGLTHLNCVCTNSASIIHICVLASCDASDQILAQQAQDAVCGIVLPEAN